MKGRRFLLGLGVSASVLILGLDLAVSLFVIPNKKITWRPIPPFEALTSEAQHNWLKNQREELAGRRKPVGIGRFDPLLGWSHRTQAESPSGLATTNVRGLRGSRDYEDELPDGVTRICAFGDSFTFCEEVADSDAWPAQLEASRSSTEVWNAGVGGFGTDQAFLRFQLMDTPGIDVLVVGLLLENIGRNVNRYRPRWYPRSDSAVAKPRFLLEGHGLRLLRQPYATREELVEAVGTGKVLEDLREGEYWIEDHLPDFLDRSGLARLYAGQRFYSDRELPRLWSDSKGEPFLVTLRLLEMFRQEGEERGATRFLVLLFPIQEDLKELVSSGRRYWSPLIDALKDRKMSFIDVAELLREPWASKPATVYTGTHLSAASNQRVAEAFDDWLKSK